MENGITSIGAADFVKKSFIGGGNSKPMFDLTVDSFLKYINEDLSAPSTSVCSVLPSKMPFCRYLFIGNFTSAPLSNMRIDNSNAQWLRSEYEARRDSELPVLIRYFSFPCPQPPANVLMLVLYSREQLLLEAKTDEERAAVPDNDWSVIAVFALDSVEVPPMPPITMMRNALGIEEGGNGVPLDKADYIAACGYWNTHAMVR